ncbi:MAG: hypothetical protein J7539_01175, partial [Niabella sp.]|nr:hypothetical protein [Niabella sp.]
MRSTIHLPKSGKGIWSPLKYCFMAAAIELCLVPGIKAHAAPGILFQQKQVTVKGKVTNEKGEPLPGVTVQVKGAQTAAVTDETGA